MSLVFEDLKVAVEKQFNEMKGRPLFVVDIPGDELWETYIESFPEGTNEIHKERREYDCQCCRHFIKAVGGLVAIDENNEFIPIWDFEIDGGFQDVVNTMYDLVAEKYIRDVYYHYEPRVGTGSNKQMLDDGEIITWHHFSLDLPQGTVKRKDSIPTKRGKDRDNKNVLKRSLSELGLEAAEVVLELIDQNSLYKGEEYRSIVQLFADMKADYDNLLPDQQDNYCWKKSMELGGTSKIRNTAIGQLLIDLSEGRELDAAVTAFEQMVAPTNYKRPTALITQGMIKKAQQKVEELGIEPALHRRYAVLDDITINNVIYADRATKKAMNVFDELVQETTIKPSSLDKVEEVSIDTFINNIVPKADSIEMLFENKHENNLMSLIAPVEPDAKNILKWNNNFTWAYNGEVTDSIKERVKAAGGAVDGVLRCSLSWFNYDDLDVHVQEPDGCHIFYHIPRSSTGGNLDVDMNAGGGRSRNAVENITWPHKDRMIEGRYKVWVNNYSKRETSNVGFDFEIEFEGDIYSFHYDKAVASKGNVTVAEFDFSRKDGIKFIDSLPESSSSKELWHVNTQTFQKVSVIMQSPNHWDDNEAGNRHWFFMLDGCKNDSKARGFFNEFLKQDLNEHRKVFEVLGSKMKTERSDDQLSGAGFSSTQRNSVFFKVTGGFSRTIKVNF